MITRDSRGLEFTARAGLQEPIGVKANGGASRAATINNNQISIYRRKLAERESA